MRYFLESPGCICIIAVNVLFFILIKMGTLKRDSLGSSYYSVINRKEYYRIFTSAFTHFDLIHLLCNMYSLYNIGPTIEHLLGTAKFVIFYVLIMIVGGFISAALKKKKPYTGAIGASGVICGLLGIYLAIAYALMGFMGISSMIPTIIILVGMSFSPKIDSIGHFVGLAVGIICGAVIIGLI